jgi:hypothetical protein
MRTMTAHVPSARTEHSRRCAKRIVLLAVSLLLTGGPGWATPQFFPGTGHYYEVVPTLDGISWTDAQAAAEARLWLGEHGHLATMASAEENQFVFDLSLDLGIWHVSTIWYIGPWIGGYQQDGAEEPDGGWAWITGESWDYTDWLPGQPDNNYLPGYNENRLVFWGQGAMTPTWNDYVDAIDPIYPPEDRVWGYTVEFDTPPVPVGEITWGQIKAAFR